MPLIKVVNIPGIPTDVIFDPKKNVGSFDDDIIRFIKIYLINIYIFKYKKII